MGLGFGELDGRSESDQFAVGSLRGDGPEESKGGLIKGSPHSSEC